MKKIVFLSLMLPLFFTNCSKSDTKGCSLSEPAVTASATETATLQAYLTANTLTATQHSSGFFYNITLQGTGAKPGLCSTITVKYTGKLLNGTVFDSNNTGAQFQLGGLIAGWQKALPVLQSGGKIKLYLPPSMGYGANAVLDGLGNVSIPANSYLVFDIELLNVQ